VVDEIAFTVPTEVDETFFENNLNVSNDEVCKRAREVGWFGFCNEAVVSIIATSD
jgi:hypothetical protein